MLNGCVRPPHTESPSFPPSKRDRADPPSETVSEPADETDSFADPGSEEPETTPAEQTEKETDGEPSDPPGPPYPTEVTLGGKETPQVLMYHLIDNDVWSPYSGLFVTPSVFSEQIELLRSAGYSFIFADEPFKAAEKQIALTFDDGYADNYTDLFPVLKEKNVPATIFLVRDLVGTNRYLNEDQIREMADSGLVHFGSHTLSHRELASLSEEEIDTELALSREYITSLTGRPCYAVSYPSGSYSGTVVSVARRYYAFGYTVDTPYYFRDTTYSSLTIPRHNVDRNVSVSYLLFMIRAAEPRF